jgi:hypothetical protein
MMHRVSETTGYSGGAIPFSRQHVARCGGQRAGLGLMLLFFASICVSAAVKAESGKLTWHASADYQEHACQAARLGAQQNAPNKAKIVDSGQCSCSKSPSGRIDCYVTVTLETSK